jgi:hypothetical protein
MKSVLCNAFLRKVAIAALAMGMTVPQVATAAGALSNFSTRPALLASPDLKTSSFLAGYRTKPRANPILRASTTFTVPSVTCTGATEGISLGIGNVRKAGKPQTLGEVWMACSGGTPFYLLSALVDSSTQTSISVSAGDVVRIEIDQGGPVVTATVRNTTTKVTVTAAGFPDSDDLLIFGSFPLFSGGVMAGVPDFGSVQFTNTKLSGEELRRVVPVERTNGATVQISPGPLLAGAFTLNFAHH